MNQTVLNGQGLLGQGAHGLKHEPDRIEWTGAAATGGPTA